MCNAKNFKNYKETEILQYMYDCEKVTNLPQPTLTVN